MGKFRNTAMATLLDESRVRYVWPCGTKRTKDHGKGPVAKRVTGFGLRFLVGYWNRGGGVIVPCPKHGRDCPAEEE